LELAEILGELEKLGSPEVKRAKAGFAITAENSHGIYMKDLKVLAAKISKTYTAVPIPIESGNAGGEADIIVPTPIISVIPPANKKSGKPKTVTDTLALQLFDTGIYEARLLCSMLFNPKNLTAPLMEKWVQTFENWEICDTYCMRVMGKSNSTKLVLPKAYEWVEHEAEYQKRAGFVLMVVYSFNDKTASNDTIRPFFPMMLKHANDERTYVMKAINWALRQVGKRNPDLCREAIEVANQIEALGTKPARWIARDALRELQNPKVVIRNYPRYIYGCA
jgi:3-methyladenine DNA glycosylase AlkD